MLHIMTKHGPRKNIRPILRAAIRGLCYGALVGTSIDLFWMTANGYWTLWHSQPGTAAEIVGMAALVGAIAEAIRTHLNTTLD
jgi:uncharacterized membrane protein YbhN (UPF0104 family)